MLAQELPHLDSAIAGTRCPGSEFTGDFLRRHVDDPESADVLGSLHEWPIECLRDLTASIEDDGLHWRLKTAGEDPGTSGPEIGIESVDGSHLTCRGAPGLVVDDGDEEVHASSVGVRDQGREVRRSKVVASAGIA